MSYPEMCRFSGGEISKELLLYPASLSHLELKTVTVTKATLTTNPERCWPDKTCKLRVRLSCQRVSASQGKSIPPTKVTTQRPIAAHICWLFANCMTVITALQYLLQRNRQKHTQGTAQVSVGSTQRPSSLSIAPSPFFYP